MSYIKFRCLKLTVSHQPLIFLLGGYFFSHMQFYAFAQNDKCTDFLLDELLNYKAAD